MTTPPDVDPAALDRLVEWGGETLLSQLLHLFLENSRERLDQIAAAVAAGGDLDQAHRAAHALKSSAANLGAMQVSAIAAELERSAADSDQDRSRERAAALVEAHRRAESELTRILEGLS